MRIKRNEQKKIFLHKNVDIEIAKRIPTNHNFQGEIFLKDNFLL